jgi:hypothetical protein
MLARALQSVNFYFRDQHYEMIDPQDNLARYMT